MKGRYGPPDIWLNGKMKEPWEEDWLPKFIGRRAAHPWRKRSVTAAGGKQQKLWDESCTACPEVSGEIGQAAGRTEDFQKGTLEKLPGKGKSFSRRAEGVWRKPVYEIDRRHSTDSHLFIIWEKEGIDHRKLKVTPQKQILRKSGIVQWESKDLSH